MPTHRRLRDRGLPFILVLAAALGAAGAVALGCERNDGHGSTGPAAPKASTPASATAALAPSASTAQSADGGAEAATYAELEGLYKELAGTATPPKEPWASLARQMAHMHQLTVSGGAMGSPGTMGGPNMMGGQGMGGQGTREPQGTMMAGHGMMWQRSCALDTWNRQMATMSHESGVAARSTGDTKLARTFDAVAEKHAKLADTIGAQPAPTDTGANGASIFAAACAPCHRPQGEGVPGVFPALRGDSVILGADERLIKVVLGGLNGPLKIGDQRYFGVMPPFGGRLNDAALAAVLTHVRSSWGNSAAPITKERVAAVRK